LQLNFFSKTKRADDFSSVFLLAKTLIQIKLLKINLRIILNKNAIAFQNYQGFTSILSIKKY